MLTEKQVLANQRNALKSTGPRTAEGKAIASQNAVRHGLRAEQTVIPGEDPDEFNQFREFLLKDLDPEGALEVMLADRIIAGFWKLYRADRIEAQLLIELDLQSEKPGLDRDELNSSDPSVKPVPEKQSDLLESRPPLALGRIFRQDFSGSNILARFRLYEGQIERSLYKALTELEKLQYL